MNLNAKFLSIITESKCIINYYSLLADISFITLETLLPISKTGNIANYIWRSLNKQFDLWPLHQGQTVTLKLKNREFETITRAKKLSRPSDDLDLIYMTSRRLLQVEMENNSSLEIRLMGSCFLGIIIVYSHTSPLKYLPQTSIIPHTIYLYTYMHHTIYLPQYLT